jgi:signal transduction histidine kinase
MNALGSRGVGLVGPLLLPDLAPEVLQIGVAVENPDQPGRPIGSLIVLYDWRGIGAILDAIRAKLTGLGKPVAAMIVNGAGEVIGGVDFDGKAARHSALATLHWDRSATSEYAVRTSDGRRLSVLAGVAGIAGPFPDWSVLVVEPTEAALAPVRAMRTQWLIISACILAVGLAIASWLARQFMRPLDEVTRATSRIAAQPQAELPLLPVRSRDEVGQLTESFNTMTTELKRSQEEALSAAKFAFAGELAALVAHEVRTPLSVMRSSAQMLANPAPAGAADNAELVETIVAEVDRVERVVTALIQLARPLDQRLAPTALRDVLSRAADFTAAHAERQQVQISCEFANGDRPAMCDPDQTYQVVLNLLVNAVQALPHGGHIWLRTLGEAHGTVGFEVADDGPGVPREIRDRLFRPFVTGRAEGTGLGLAFVERVVKAHRGSVSMRSGADRGTVFEVRLPVAEQ